VTASIVYRRPRNMAMAAFAGSTYRSTGIRADGTVVLIVDSVDRPVDEGLVRHPQADTWIRVVRADECDRVVEVTTYADYHRHRCFVEQINEDGTALLLIGTESPGFSLVEEGIYQRQVHVNDLRNYHEIHRDLLFGYWLERRIERGV